MKNKKRMLTMLCVVLSVVLMASCLFGCKPKGKTYDNEKDPLVIQVSELGGIFNPLFQASAYDKYISDVVLNPLITIDKDGAFVASDEYETIAKSLKTTFNEDGTVNYEMVIKNGLKFSDGSDLTIEDVLFTFYTYLDPKYDGNAVMYTLPIEGLIPYRTQVDKDKAEKLEKIANAIWKIGKIDDYKVKEEDQENGVTQDYYDAYWKRENFDAASTEFIKTSVSGIVAELGGQYAGALHPLYDYDTIKTNKLENALYSALAGLGGILNPFVEKADGEFIQISDIYRKNDGSEKDSKLPQFNWDEEKGFVTALDENLLPTQGEFVKIQSANIIEYTEENFNKHKNDNDLGLGSDKETALSGVRVTPSYIFQLVDKEEKYDLSKGEVPTIEDLKEVAFMKFGKNYDKMSSDIGGNFTLDYFLNSMFVKEQGEGEGEESYKDISGITTSKKTIDGEEFDVLNIKLDKIDPTAAQLFQIPVQSKNYHTKGYKYQNTKENFNAYGVEYNSTEFMNHLKSQNSEPFGSGPYKFLGFKDNIVTLERNPYFECFGFGNAKIKTLRFKVISTGGEFNAVNNGEVHFALIDATPELFNSIGPNKQYKNLNKFDTANLGYGYININAEAYPNLDERKAIASLFDLDIIIDNYYLDMAELIYRSMSTTLDWVYKYGYPEGLDKPYYSYDVEEAKALFKKAGYKWDNEGNMIDPDTGKQADFTFTLPSDAASHPAGMVFVNAKNALEKMGATAHLDLDNNIIENVNAGKVAIYTLAWQATPDPDLYQVYHYNAKGNSVIGNGIKWLWNNTDEGDDQHKKLKKLGDAIENARNSMEPADRAPEYKKALDTLIDLAIEIPTYQRKNVYAYQSGVIDRNSFPDEENITAYRSPLAEIWNLEFVD